MSAELIYEGSPIAALSVAWDDGVRPGGFGVVVARPGVGKSALLVHVALDALLRERPVLHVAIRDTVESARAHYDEVFRAINQAGLLADGGAAMLRAERHRMIHSYLDSTFDVALLRKNLDMLREMANFRPRLLLFDGFGVEALTGHLAALRALAVELDAPLWLAVRETDQPPPEILTGEADVVLRLSAEGRGVRVSVAHAGGAERLSLELDPATLLVRDGGVGGAETRAKASEATLYSGGARGSEEVFGEAAERFGVHEVNFTFEGHKQERTRGSYQLSARELAAGDVSLVYVSRRLNRTYTTEGGLIRRVLQALWHMVSRSQQVFVIGKIQDDGTVVGGTGWSVELARMWNKDLWVYDQDKTGWFRWEGNAWVAGTPVVSSAHFTGTGTRYVTAEAKAAVFDLFERSFAKRETE